METRVFEAQDAAAVFQVYVRAFAGFPWFEELSGETVAGRWRDDSQRDGFHCLVAIRDENVVGAIWGDTPGLGGVREERGGAIAHFASGKVAGRTLVWIRDLIVDPASQGRGIGTELRKGFVSSLVSKLGAVVFLTRHHPDNEPVIRISRRLGFQPSGILVPSVKFPGVHHEYWWLVVDPA